jgi:hypothetical protein
MFDDFSRGDIDDEWDMVHFGRLDTQLSLFTYTQFSHLCLEMRNTFLYEWTFTYMHIHK